MSQDKAREMPGPRNPVRWGLVGVLMVLACVGAWLAAHQLRSVPPDPWPGETFSSPVPERENGLVVARVLPPRGDEDFEAWVSEGADPEAAWTEATERLLGLREHVEPHRATMETIDARPRFVEDCRAALDAPCDLLATIRPAELAGLLALSEVAILPPYDDDFDGGAAPLGEASLLDRDAWARADDRLARSVERARDFHATSYSLVGTMVGVVLLSRSLTAAAPTVAGAGRVGASLPRLRATLEAPFETRDLRRGFLFDQRIMRRALLDLPSDPFFDRARSIGELDARTAELVAYAEDPSRPAPSFEVHVDHFGWWLYDATGKAHLDMMAADGARLVTQASTRQADAERARVALLTQLRSLE